MIARLADALATRRLAALTILSTLATAGVVAAAIQHHGEPDSALVAALRRAPATVAAPSPAAAATPRAPSTGAPAPTPAPSAVGRTGSGSAGGRAWASIPAATTTPTPAQSPTDSTTTTNAQSKSATTKIKHVFVIALATSGAQAFATGSSAGYLRDQLRPRAALLNAYGGLGNELSDYIALISGQGPNPQTAAGCLTYADFPAGTKPDASGQVPGSGCVYPLTTLTLPDQLTSAGLSWRAYVEDMGTANGAPGSCRHPSPNAQDPTAATQHGDEYATRGNPFVYFHSLLDLGDCATNDVSLDRLTGDLAAAKTTPNFAFIAPNVCDAGTEQPCQNGAAGGLAAADTFISHWVPAITDSSAYRKGGLLMIVFAGASGGQPQPGALLLSRYVRPGVISNVRYDPYALLRSIEDIFRLKRLAHASSPSAPSLLSDVLRASRDRG